MSTRRRTGHLPRDAVTRFVLPPTDVRDGLVSDGRVGPDWATSGALATPANILVQGSTFMPSGSPHCFGWCAAADLILTFPCEGKALKPRGIDIAPVATTVANHNQTARGAIPSPMTPAHQRRMALGRRPIQGAPPGPSPVARQIQPSA